MKNVPVSFLTLGVLASSWAFGKAPMSQELPYVRGEVLVKVKADLKSKFLSEVSSLGMEVKKEMNLLAGEYVVLKSQNKSTLTLISELKGHPDLEYSEPNFIYHTQESPTLDPLFGKLWGMDNTGSNEPDRNGNYSSTKGVVGADIQATKAWNLTRGSKNVVIAIIDTGIDYRHEDLKNNIWVNPNEIAGNNLDDDGNGFVDDVHGWNSYKDHGDPMDGNAHGTHCAGTIGAQHGNSTGVAGVMDEVQLMAVKFLSDEGSGSLDDAVEAIDYATKMNVDLMSNSWGGGGFSQALKDAITKARDRGILFVAAAGNDGTNNDSRPHYPSNYEVENVVSVAAHTSTDTLASFSCFGKRTVHVAAPGYNILSSVPNNQYKVFSGTSMATPHVSGVLGLLLSQEGRMPVTQSRNRLMATVTPARAYRRTTISGGRVNAYNLLTDTRVPQDGPDESAWKTEALNEVFETKHPYQNGEDLARTYTFPGAKYVKLIVEKYDTESGYDFLILKDGEGNVVEKLSGSGANYETDYVETDTLTIGFTSDSSQTSYGVIIREAKVIY